MFRISKPLEAAAKEASVGLVELDKAQGDFCFGGAPYALIDADLVVEPGIFRGQITCPLNGRAFNLFLLENGARSA